jgi:hypothetical protein
MSGRVLRFEGSAHTEADRLLPWLANDTLEGEELTRVRAHLDECAACRRELEWLRSLQAAYAEQAAPATPARTPRRLRQRIALAHGKHRPGRSRWQRWLIAVQAAVMLVMGLALLQHDQRPAPAPAYHALAAPVVARDRLVVVFDPMLSEMHMRRLLQACDARVVDGPTASGAWVLSVPSARADAIREALRAAPGVTFVERLDGRH